jgi:hypothetical protein
MTIADAPVTRETRGFHQAFFSVQEILNCKFKQDQLDDTATIKEIPYHSLLQIFNYYENQLTLLENPAFRAAIEQYRLINLVPSLKRLARSVLVHNRNDYDIATPEGAMNLSDYLTDYLPKFRDLVWVNNPEHKPVIDLINERIAELTAFEIHVKDLEGHAVKIKKIQRCASAIGVHLSYSSPALYGLYSLPTSLIFCLYPTGPMLASDAAMLFFGVPGFIVLGISLVSLALVVNYTRQYGCDEACKCGFSDVLSPLVRRDSNLAVMLDSLIAILRTENLPYYITNAIAELANNGVTFERTLYLLDTIIQYYIDHEIPNIRNDKSQTPYSKFNSNTFFWTDAERKAHRENNLPPHIAMNDDLPHFKITARHNMLFANRPQRLMMEDDNNGEFPAFTSVVL